MRRLLFVSSAILTGLLFSWAIDRAAVSLFAQSTTSGKEFHVSGASIPTSTPTNPIPAEGGVLTGSVVVDMLVIANKDSAAHTITVQDGQATPFILFNAYTIPAATTWTIYMPGTRFASGFKWQASDATVFGTVTGRR